MIIYKCINKLTRQCYIGLTTNTLHNRIVDHKYEAFKRMRNNKFHSNLRVWGMENFEWSVLLETDDPIVASEKENEYILAYNSIEDGYNTQLRNDIKSKVNIS